MRRQIVMREVPDFTKARRSFRILVAELCSHHVSLVFIVEYTLGVKCFKRKKMAAYLPRRPDPNSRRVQTFPA